MSVEIPEDSEVVVQLNHPLASGYLAAMKELSTRYGLENDVTVSVLSRYSDIFTVRKPPEDEEAVWLSVRKIADEAVARFISMRETEGRRLQEDVLPGRKRSGRLSSRLRHVRRRLWRNTGRS